MFQNLCHDETTHHSSNSKTATKCLPSVTGARRVHSSQYPGWWTHVPSRQVTVGPMEQERGFVAVTGELVVESTSQVGPMGPS